MNTKTIIFLSVVTVIGFIERIASWQEQKILPMIYPGMGIAEIKLGAPADSAKKYWGEKADEVTKVMIGDKPEFLLLYRDRGILFLCNEKGQVQRIVCKSPALLVKGSGMRVGSSRKEMEKAYPMDKPDEKSLLIYDPKNPKSRLSAYRLVIFKTKGVAYTMKDNRIVAITVFSTRAMAEKQIFSVVMSVGLSWDELLYLSAQ